jgi:hypothetical protein
MDYKKVLESYAGKALDFQKDVILVDDGDGVIKIKEWSVSGKTKPTDAQITALWNTNKIAMKKERALDKSRLKFYEKWEEKLINDAVDSDNLYTKEVSDIGKMTETQLDAYLQG